MSGNYKKNKPAGNRKRNTGRKPRLSPAAVRKILWIAIAVVSIALCLLISFLFSLREGIAMPLPPTTTESTQQPTIAPTTAPNRIEESQEISMNLGHGLVITDIGSYTGIYMEDGSDEIISGILMIQVSNTGSEDIEYAEIRLTVGEKDAQFSVSTLQAGNTVILLEKNRMPYSNSDTLTYAAMENAAVFRKELSLCEDQIQLQILDGAINVKNISGEDIDGDIVVYYKNYAADLYYGGITYMVRIQGGLKAEEIRQAIAGHISPTGSRVMFVTCGE